MKIVEGSALLVGCSKDHSYVLVLVHGQYNIVKRSRQRSFQTDDNRFLK